MTTRPVPRRHWRSYGPRPPRPSTSRSAPSRRGFLRIECDRCGKVQMINETHTAKRAMPIRDIIDRMRHDGCGGRAGKVELITGIEGASSGAGAEDAASGVTGMAGSLPSRFRSAWRENSA